MSIHPISVTVISGKENAAEIVFTACSFLKMSYAYIDPVSPNSLIRDEFLLSFQVYRIRESFDYIPEKEYIDRLLLHENSTSLPQNTFCIALDEQGHSIAKEVLLRDGISPYEKVHKNICVLNLIESNIPPYPKITTTVKYWKKIRSQLYNVAWEHRRVGSKMGKRRVFDKYVPASSREKVFYTWYKTFEEILLPWRHNIGEVIADLS